MATARQLSGSLASPVLRATALHNADAECDDPATMPPTRRRTQQTGDRAVTATEELLNEAGCAVNELVQNDYGFDLHVQLPAHVPRKVMKAGR
jgi:hypothetical protein